MDLMKVMLFLLSLFIITFYIMLITLISEFLHIEKKQYISICLLSTLVLFHKTILKFSFMYITYSIIIFIWCVVLIYNIYQLLLKKKLLPTLFIICVFFIFLFSPTFGNLRQYYLYKPIFLLRSHSILEKNNYLPFLSFMTCHKVYVVENKVYYELGQIFSFDNTGGIIITFDGPPSQNDWDKYISFDKIDNNSYFYITHK